MVTYNSDEVADRRRPRLDLQPNPLTPRAPIPKKSAKVPAPSGALKENSERSRPPAEFSGGASMRMLFAGHGKYPQAGPCRSPTVGEGQSVLDPDDFQFLPLKDEREGGHR